MTHSSLDEYWASGQIVSGEGGELEQLTLLLFRLAGGIYATRIESVQRIVPIGPVAYVPGVPRHVLGVLNHRGAIVPIVDTRRLLGLHETALDAAARIMLVHLEALGCAVGCVIEDLHDIIAVAAAQVQPALPTSRAELLRYAEGVIPGDGALITLLDLTRLDTAQSAGG